MLKKHSFLIVISLFTILIFTNSSKANAQIKFGVKAGIDLADHKINTSMLNTRNRLGFHVGPTLEVGLPLIGGIETGLLYGHKEYKAEFKDSDAYISDYNYLTLPLNLKKRWGLGVAGIFVYGGPYATLKLNGGDVKSWTEDVKSKNFGMGLNFGAGVNLLKKVDVAIQYRVDLTDRYSSDKVDISKFTDKKQQTWSIALTYFL